MSTFEPGFSPTITAVVFLETESVTLAPFASSAARACSRDQRSSVPVMTYVCPVSGPSTGFSASPSSSRMPRPRSSSTSARLRSSANQVAIDSARSGPMPSTSSMSSCPAASRASTEPKCRARFCAVTQPTSGMFSPKRTRAKGICFEAAIESTAFCAEMSA